MNDSGTNASFCAKTDPADIISALHSLRIRNPGNDPVTGRITSVMGLLETTQEPEGRPGHHDDARRILFRTSRELQPLLGGK